MNKYSSFIFRYNWTDIEAETLVFYLDLNEQISNHETQVLYLDLTGRLSKHETQVLYLDLDEQIL